MATNSGTLRGIGTIVGGTSGIGQIIGIFGPIVNLKKRFSRAHTSLGKHL